MRERKKNKKEETRKRGERGSRKLIKTTKVN